MSGETIIKHASDSLDEAKAAAEGKLKTSGLTPEDAVALNIDVLTAKETGLLGPTFLAQPSLRFNYLHPRSGAPMQDWYACGDYFRVRYLAGDQDQRYAQAPDTLPVAYYPPNFDWASVMSDNSPVLITEGELKAAKACKEGFPTIGLGGVHAWKSSRHAIPFISSLEILAWPRRVVYITFDSDYRTNPHVVHALRELAHALERRGAFPRLVSLPTLYGMPKVGLDDFLVCETEAPAKLTRLLGWSEPLGVSEPLWKLNDRFVFIQKPGVIVDRYNDNNKISPQQLKLFDTADYQKREILKDGGVKYVATSAAGDWLGWPMREEASRIDYAPGKEQIFVDEAGARVFNEWPGMGCAPVYGDVTPFVELINYLTSQTEESAKRWLWQWMAYPLQHVGTKLYSCVVWHGKQGTGKSLAALTLGRIYGKNTSEVTEASLKKDFNSWAANRQFVIGEEITGNDNRAEADRLKVLITQSTLTVNEKWVKEYESASCINYWFNSNHPTAIFMDDDDRRFAIFEITKDPLPQAFYQRYDDWLRDGGASHVYHHLLHVDLDGFNPNARPPMTTAKARMVLDGQSDLSSWVYMLMHDPDEVLRVGQVKIMRDCFTNQELLQLYGADRKVTPNGLGRALSKQHCKQANEGMPIRVVGRGTSRYYILRNAEKWETATPQEVAKHVLEHSATGDQF